MAKFELSIDKVLVNEGGYSFNPSDPGGETNFGISKRAYPDLDIKNLTIDQAKAIYLRDFWLFDGITEQIVADKLFDAYVNMKHMAIRLAQEVIGVIPDGIYGPNTQMRINAIDGQKFVHDYKYRLVTYYQEIVKNNPKLGIFLVGWLRRANQ